MRLLIADHGFDRLENLAIDVDIDGVLGNGFFESRFPRKVSASLVVRVSTSVSSLKLTRSGPELSVGIPGIR